MGLAEAMEQLMKARSPYPDSPMRGYWGWDCGGDRDFMREIGVSRDGTRWSVHASVYPYGEAMVLLGVRPLGVDVADTRDVDGVPMRRARFKDLEEAGRWVEAQYEELKTLACSGTLGPPPRPWEPQVTKRS